MSDDTGVSELLGMSDSIELVNTDNEACTMGVDVISVPTDAKEEFSVAKTDDFPSLSDDAGNSDTDDIILIGSDDAIFTNDGGVEYMFVFELTSVDIIGLFVSKVSVVCDIDISGVEPEVV